MEVALEMVMDLGLTLALKLQLEMEVAFGRSWRWEQSRISCGSGALTRNRRVGKLRVNRLCVDGMMSTLVDEVTRVRVRSIAVSDRIPPFGPSSKVVVSSRLWM